jgi:hypothetical protein
MEGHMTEQELAIWSEQFKAKLAETDAIIAQCEAECRRIAARLGGAPWPR